MIFVSVPYSHPDQLVVQDRVRILSHYCGKLLEEGKWNLSPVTHGTTISRHVKLPMDFNFWQHISYEMLKVCEEMHVLMLEGWEDSIGVLGEINYAKMNNIPIHYVEIGFGIIDGKSELVFTKRDRVTK